MKRTTFSAIQLLAFQFYLVNGFHQPKENFPVDTCSVIKRSCQIHEDNLLTSVIAIEVDECRERCNKYYNCNYFSHFGPDNYPINNYCMLFSSCPALEDCDDCSTEKELCSCGTSLEGKLDENVIAFVPDIEMEFNCKDLCRNEIECLYYTHYGKENDHYANLCVLLTDIEAPFQECNDCITSVPFCVKSSYACKFTVNDENTFYDSYMFTNPENSFVNGSITHDYTVKFPLAANLSCEAVFVAIGGGGNGINNWSHYYAAGGSGEINNVAFKVSSAEYQVLVGSYLSESYVFVDGQDENIIVARYGNCGTSSGGEGYSGGGGKDGKGGSNGSNGGGENGGTGNGFDISEISMENFVLTPGDGGETNDEHYGGGGGGVLVNNHGPPAADANKGKGFGGGGGSGGLDYEGKYGSPGVVLLEVKSK